ncbi:MAG: aspartyl/glutamyl-tRNA amidotransferase subunit A [Patescibacteria group bacterium]|nr:aspartyl/glutamyl-tRNA amidotransferase subunit A [Patescibacteria group bacterium]
MNLLGKTVLEIKSLIEKKKISYNELWEFFLKRIKKYNPRLNVFLTIVDKKTNKIPIAVKDNFCTKDIRTTAASLVLDNFIPPYESTVTKRLIDNGFSVIGKTNMDAWAHGSSTETSDYRPTKNPWDLERSPGGSSGGSAAAVISYLAPAAIGSETAGSIRGPASWCGVIGLKPTYGRVSRYGLIAMGSSLDCPGPLTLSVKDAAYILELIAGKDFFDATSSLKEKEKYSDFLNKKKSYILGIADDYFEGVDKETEKKVNEAIEIFKKMGHRIKKIKLLSPKYAISVYTILQRVEVSSNLARYDGIKYGNSRQNFKEEAKKRMMLGAYTISFGCFDAYYKKAQQVRTLIIQDFNEKFKEVDMILSPTMPITALKLGEFKKYPFFGEKMDVLAEPAAVAGLPAISFPVGLDKNNLPIGLQLVGRYFEEKEILNLSYQFEKETEFFGVIKKGIERYSD